MAADLAADCRFNRSNSESLKSYPRRKPGEGAGGRIKTEMGRVSGRAEMALGTLQPLGTPVEQRALPGQFFSPTHCTSTLLVGPVWWHRCCGCGCGLLGGYDLSLPHGETALELPERGEGGQEGGEGGRIKVKVSGD